MNFGLFEIAILLGSAVSAVAGALAAIARRRAASLIVINGLFVAVFGYFLIQGLRFGGGVVLILLAALVGLHATTASAIVERARKKEPA